MKKLAHETRFEFLNFKKGRIVQGQAHTWFYITDFEVSVAILGKGFKYTRTKLLKLLKEQAAARYK